LANGSPIAGIHVAADRGDGRYPAELRDDVGVADIAAMDDVVDTSKKAHGLWTQQSVGVGDDADPE
jgi:hypothetical protein